MASPHWVILTGEYPPQPGGVSDYTRQLTNGLLGAGDGVTVVAPRCDDQAAPAGVDVRRLSDHFGAAGLAELSDMLQSLPKPRVVLVQYVPHAFGARAMNVRFVAFLKKLSMREQVWVMFHEVWFPLRFGQPPQHTLLALVHRWMARTVTRCARRTFVTVPAWADRIRPFLRHSPEPLWLPVPSNVCTNVPAALRDHVRARVRTTPSVIGHFGTYGHEIASVLRDVIVTLSSKTPANSITLLLTGRGSLAFAESLTPLVRPNTVRVLATGELSDADLAAHLLACDVLVQPYPDGISTRRSSAMAGLALGVPVVTTSGAQTEPLWQQTRAVVLCNGSSTTDLTDAILQLLQDPVERSRLSEASQSLYKNKFSIEHTVRALRESEKGEYPLFGVQKTRSNLEKEDARKGDNPLFRGPG